MSAPGLVTELVGALGGFVRACRCRGTGRYLTDCTLCGDSTHDHVCNDREVTCEKPACVAARKAIDRATPEAVRKADAAPEMYEALVDWQTIELEMNTLGVTCLPEDRLEEVSNQRDRAIVEAGGKL